MKRILIATVASALLASAANAAFNVTVDVDKPAFSYSVGDLVTIDLTLTTDGTHTMGAFGAFEYQASWDPAALRVANAGPDNPVSPNGNSTQTLFDGLSGSENPACSNPGTGPGGTDSCVTLSQVNGSFSTLDVSGTVTAQLVLELIGGSPPLQDLLTIGTETGSETADSITIGPNYTAVPEPTTAALVGFGLIGLGAASRRR